MNLDFKAELAKAEEVDGRYFISGVASTTDKDLQNDILTPNALKEMAATAVGIPIVTRHSDEELDSVGSIVEASYDDGKLIIKAELDSSDPLAMRTYRKIAKSKTMGFSIGASVKRLTKNVDPKARYTVDSVKFRHCALTSVPVNTQTFCMALAKSLNEEKNMSVENDSIEAVDPKKSPINPTAEVHVPAEPKAEDKAAAPDVKASADGRISIGGAEPVKIGDSLQERTSNVPGTGDHGGEMLKAGAALSADSMAKLKDIHDSSNMDEVKSKVRSMLGANADAVLNVNSGDNSGYVGLEKFLSDFKADLIKSVQIELAKAKSAPKPLTVDPAQMNPTDLRSQLIKAFNGK